MSPLLRGLLLLLVPSVLACARARAPEAPPPETSVTTRLVDTFAIYRVEGAHDITTGLAGLPPGLRR